MKLRVKIKAAGLGTNFLNFFFFKNWHLFDRSLRSFIKNSEQRPKGHSAGLHMAFLALKSISLQGFLKKSGTF